MGQSPPGGEQERDTESGVDCDQDDDAESLLGKEHGKDLEAHAEEQ